MISKALREIMQGFFISGDMLLYKKIVLCWTARFWNKFGTALEKVRVYANLWHKTGGFDSRHLHYNRKTA